MQFYLAPMEGLTGYVFRNAYRKNFGDVDKYFTPFIANKKMSSKEIRDILPEHNLEMKVVPQILTNRADDFLAITKELKQYGYDTVNLNLGCPSGTVAAKQRGAGFLSIPTVLDAFLEEIFQKCPLRISIKTRIGVESHQEWENLCAIYQKYPVEELIIHPRVQKDYYKNVPDRDLFYATVDTCKLPLCYNGDICSRMDYEDFQKQLSAKCSHTMDKIMIGRGILKNPGLIRELRGGCQLTVAEWKTFHDDVLNGYLEVLSGERNTLFRMKELWFYMGQNFINAQKYLKQMKKVQHIAEYKVAVSMLFQEAEIKK